MSKKIELTPDQVKECLKMYNEDLLGSTTISERMGIHKTIIIRTLKENGVMLGPSGRRNIGGKSVSDKKYQEKNKEKLKVYYKLWSKANRKELRDYHKIWRKDNPEHKEKVKKYELEKTKREPKYRLCKRTRTSVWQCLKERNINKTNSTFQLLGYNIEELMTHLEKQFTEGMTWDNYGEWHVDHIKPMTSFKFESVDDPEFKECWALSNLQPLWWNDNLSKGPRYL